MIVDIDAAGSGIDVNLNVYLYPVHITYCLMAVYDSIEWDRTSAYEGASVHIWFHSPTQPMHEM